MGRKSALTPDQWLEVERRHLVEGESLNSLAAAYGVNESSLRRRLKPRAEGKSSSPEQLKQLATNKARVDAEQDAIRQQIAALPYAKQEIVADLARKLRNTSEHLASAAELGAATAHRLSRLANQQLEKVDDIDPLISLRALQGVGTLTRLANVASEIGLNLLRANKDAMQPEDEPPGPVEVTFVTKDARKPQHEEDQL
ncbi:Hin recombinase [Herbaspirillum sp. WKF16]|uniref:Hin recombinase n=1 Tax=Herbaspirillum sp. WKF16 TaxID=3028312 RepID=UPI0023A9DC26|nr:Hin recombinase [Herbaspirillum sp. WKF16]WDZ97968.1 Hin recombinase [Herbaspirillum sp. WKF16]